MSTAALKTVYKKYFHKLLFYVIAFLFFFLEQSHSQCTSVSIYDRIVSGYHSTLAVKTDGKIAVWGEYMGFGGVNQLSPRDLIPPSPITPIMGTVGGGLVGGYDQVVLLASDGLYALGYNLGISGGALPTSVTSTSNFQKISTPLGGDATTKLPNGIAADDVASIFATYKTLLIVTKNDYVNGKRNGQVWIITQASKAVEANGGSATFAGSSTWKRVITSTSAPLMNIIAARGQISPISPSPQCNSAFMALAANGDVYTWGNTTYLGDNSGVAEQVYATKMVLPAEFSSTNVPKMIGVTGGTKNAPFTAKNTYYLLSNSGSLYALGDNSKRQCGDFTTTERTGWVNVKSASSTNFTNINFISVQEHTGGIPCASAITTDGKLYTWGEDDAGMLGKGTGTISSYDPGVASYNPGIANGSVGSTALFCEMGGHTLMYLKVGSDKFCYVGHKARGSMGDGTNDDNYITSFDCTNTPQISICGSVPITPDANSSSISASPNTIEANGISTSTITVQLLNGSGGNLTTSGGVVVITTNAGTISSIIDNYNGTYTAILTSPIASATANLRFTVNGVLSSATTDVVFTPTVPPSTPESITGAGIVCPSTTGLVYSVAPVANATTYTWTFPQGWTITAGQGTNSITVTAGSYGQNGLVYVSAGNVIGNTTNTSGQTLMAVTVRPDFSSGEISSTGETICYSGIPAVIGSITASSGGDGSIAYSWRSSADAYATAIPSATLATYSPPAGLTSTISYRRYANDGLCNTTATVSAGTWTVTVLPAFATGTISSTGETICNGGTPTMTIGSTTESSGGNGNIAYSWRSSADGYAIAIPSATLATYTPPVGLTSTTSYRRYANDGLCNTAAAVSSGTWTVTVRAAFSAGEISSAGETICYGGTPTLIGSTTASSGGNGIITYSWRSSADGYGAAIASATAATYTPPAGLTSTTSYRRYANDGLCNIAAAVSSGTWTVTVRAAFSAGAISSTGETICYNGDPVIIGSTIASTGGDALFTYKWQANGVDIGSSNSATYDPPTGLTATTTYTRYAKDGTCNLTYTSSSGTYTVTVRPNFSAGEISSTGEIICNGGTPITTIGSTTASSGGNGVITYSWRSSADGYVATIASAISATYTPPAGLTSTTSYRRYANDGLCNTAAAVSSGIWTVTVRAAFSAGAISSTGETICNGGNPTLIGSATASSGGDGSITYSWRSSADAYATAIASATSATYIPPAGLTSTTFYRRYANDGLCNTTANVSIGTWTVTVRPIFSSGEISSTGETICNGGTPIATIGSTTESSGGNGSITYSWRSSADGYIAAIPSATLATYTPPAGLTSTSSYRRYANDGLCNTTAIVSIGTWTVTVRAAFSSGAISSTGETICNGGTPITTIGSTAASSGGNGSITYSWRSSADGYSAAIPSATLATYTPPAGLTGTTSYRRYANDGLCNTAAAVSSGTWTVTVRAAFSVGAIISTGETICYNGNPLLIGSTIASSGGDASITYKWQANGVDIGSSNSVTFDPPTGLTATTTYTRYAKDGTCNLTYALSSGTYTVTVRPNFSAGTIRSNGETICYNGDPVIIGSTTASTGGDASITYKWQANGVDIGSSNSTTYDPPTGLTATTTYTRYAKDGTCNLTYALSTGTWLVMVNPLPIPSFTAQPGATACPNTDVTYTTEAGQSNYEWAVPGVLNTDYTITSGGTTSSNTVTLKWLTTGSKTVTINYTNSNSCTAVTATSSTATTVSARPSPSLTTQPGATVCANTNVTYTTEPGQNNYVWTGFGTLNTDYTITSGGTAISNTVTLKWLTAGVKTVSINYSNSNNCTAELATLSTATTVSARPIPAFSIQPGVGACQNSELVYTTQSSQTNYIWSLPGTLNTDYSIISGGIDITSNTVTLKWLTTGSKTVTINYTNSNNCTAESVTSSSATVVNALPSPSFIAQPGATACLNTDVTYTTESGQSNYLWTVPGILNTDYSLITGGIGTNSNSVRLKWLTTGTKIVTINYSNSNNCTAASATSSTATTISAINTVSNASFTPTICINTALTSITHLTTGATDISSSGIVGINGLPAGVSASWASNTITISGTPSSSGIFNYSIPLTGGCGLITATGSIVVAANNVVTVSSAAGTDNQTNCINTPITSIAYSTTGATGITFSGLPAGVAGVSVSNNGIISGTPSAAGVFNYTVALTGGCGVISAQGTIKVNALPEAAIISPSTTLLTCSTTTINVTATGGVNYLWSNGLGTASTASITAPGTYMVKVTDANICSSTASITITQNIVVPSSYAVTGTGSYCSGGAGLPIGLAGSQIGVLYQLQANGINSGIAIAGTGSAINFGNKLAAGTYSVIATNATSSCTNIMTGTAVVKVLNLPVAGVITGATTLCAGIVGQTYTIASISNAANYTWSVPIGWTINSVQGDTLLTVTTGQVGQAGDIKLVPGNVCGLGSAATLAVAVLPMSTSSISSGSANQTICMNTALVNTVFSTTGATSASFTGLPAGVTGEWANNAIRLSGSPTLAGSFIYTISLLGGCKIVDQTGTINVIADNQISRSSAAATDSQNICIANAITQIEYTTISATGILVTGLPDGLQAVYASNKISITGTPTVVGVFNYTILLQGGCGQVTTNGTVNIHALPTGTIAASNNGIICEGATVLLSATGGNNYQWYFNGNAIAGVATASYSASLPGMYSVKLISDKGCANFVKSTPTLILNSAPIVGFSFDKYCINTPIYFTNTSTTNLSGPVSMLWDFGDNSSTSITSPTHSFLIEKSNAVKLTITPANCPLLAKSISKNVQIEIPPKGIKYPTVYAVKNSNTPLTARASGKIYSWSPSTGLNNPAIKSPIFNYTGPSNYQVQITNDAGCIYSDSVNVMIFDQADFFVPKAFSPNNDGHNDKLLFVMPGIEKLAYFRIFNRWGNLVFETTNVNISWDGMFRGVAQPSESYSWFAEGISNMGNKIQRSGQILILR